MLKNVSGMFCLLVPAFAMVGLGDWSASWKVDDLAPRGANVAVLANGSGSDSTLEDWQFTSCCCEASSQPIRGLGSWQYTGSGNSYAGGGASDRSAIVRPIINIFVVNIQGGGRRAFGSRRFADSYGKNVQTVNVSRDTEQSRFRNIIAMSQPGLFGSNSIGGNANGAFDIGNIFSSLVRQRTQRAGGLTIIATGFDITNVFNTILSQVTNGGVSSTGDGGFVAIASAPVTFGFEDILAFFNAADDDEKKKQGS